MRSTMYGAAAIIVTIATTLTGCASPKLAGEDGDREGKNFEAKPHMARLYIINGYQTKGIVTSNSGESVSAGAPVYYYKALELDSAGTVLASTIFAGPLSTMLAAGDQDKVDKPVREKRTFLEYKIYLDDNYIGRMYRKEYMAVDLSPGSHQMYFKISDRPSVKISIDLNEGETAFFLANWGVSMGSYWERCVDCQPLIFEDHRVEADLSGKLSDGPF